MFPGFCARANGEKDENGEWLPDDLPDERPDERLRGSGESMKRTPGLGVEERMMSHLTLFESAAIKIEVSSFSASSATCLEKRSLRVGASKRGACFSGEGLGHTRFYQE